MTKLFLGLSALAFVALAPMAAQANAVSDCALNSNTCLDGGNLIGKTVIFHGSTGGGGAISDTSEGSSSGSSTVTYTAAREPAGQGSNGAFVPN